MSGLIHPRGKPVGVWGAKKRGGARAVQMGRGLDVGQGGDLADREQSG